MSNQPENDMCKEMRIQMNANRKSGMYSDVTIIAEDGSAIHAHKIVLSSVTWNVTTLLRDSRILLRYKSNDIEKIINFVYTGVIDIKDTTEAINFYKIADKLNFKHLESKTMKFLMEKTKLSSDCLDIWFFSLKEKNKKLQRSCEEGIFKNCKTFMISSKEKLTEFHMDLLLSNKNCKLNDFDKYEIIKSWGEFNIAARDGIYPVKKLFDEYVTWSEIDVKKIPLIIADPYMDKNFKAYMHDNITRPGICENKLRKKVLDWDSYSEYESMSN